MPTLANPSQSPTLPSQQHRRNRLAASGLDRFQAYAGGVLLELCDLWRTRSASDAAHGLRSVSLRYLNAAGADPKAEIREAHELETHLIPLVGSAARDGTAIKVFGNGYDTADGTCIRDYVHVLDIADAHVRTLRYLINGGATCAVNLANERGCSVLEVVATAERVTGKSIHVELVPRRPGDPSA